MKRRRSDSCGRRFVLLLLWRISAAMPVYELSRHETVHEHHARLLRRRRRRRRRRTMMNNFHVNVTDSSDDDDDDDDDDAHEWRALRDYQATRHLSRYEYRHRIKHGLDLQLNWDGDYGDEEDYYYEMDHPFQSLSRQPDIPNATSPHNIRNTIHSPHGHRHLAKRNDTTSHAQALWISNQNHQSHMDAYQSVPLSQGYGTHLANIWVGSPQPQRKTVIVDTGSHFTAFPCTGCNNCGGSYHTDPYFDPSKSSRYMTDQVFYPLQFIYSHGCHPHRPQPPFINSNVMNALVWCVKTTNAYSANPTRRDPVGTPFRSVTVSIAVARTCWTPSNPRINGTPLISCLGA